MTDWTDVLNKALAAAENVLGASWAVASTGATSQITSLVQTAQYVDANKANMKPAEYQLLLSQQKATLQNVFTAYASIGLAAAQDAIAEIVNVIVTAAPGLIGAL